MKTKKLNAPVVTETRPDGSPLAKIGDVMASRSGPSAPHMVIVARAGTGKTTTLIEGLKRMLSPGGTTLIPSDQQKQIWDALEEGKAQAKTYGMVAFNKSIAEELQRRVPPGVEAMTMHSLGFKAILAAFPGTRVETNRTTAIVSRITGIPEKTLRGDEYPLFSKIDRVVSLCKMTLTDPCDAEAMDEMLGHYDIDLNGDRQRVLETVPAVIAACKQMVDRMINFDDMVWLPIALNLTTKRYDVLLVDEAQDLNRCQQELAKKAGRRLILCGDPRQAIYGFAGADSSSMPRMENQLQNLGGCKTFPLNVTRRCAKAIVKEAQLIVPDFTAWDECKEGTVERIPFGKGEYDTNSYHVKATPGSMVLSRTNAILVSQCFKFLKKGRPAKIQGREIGKNLQALVKKIDATTLEDLTKGLEEWKLRETAKELARKYPRETKLAGIEDRFDCLMTFVEECDSVAEVNRKLETIFTDTPKGDFILLSSIHKAKGLEATKVFYLTTSPMRMDKMQQWELDQESNLRYVAITRAIESLYLVS